MSSIGDASTHGRTRLSFASVADIDEFVATLDKFERGEITPDQWRGFRLVRGTYGQRQADDAQMLRVKVPQGVLDAAQLNALAEVAEKYSRGFGHITTRQNIQFHFVKLHDVEPAMRRLEKAGMTTREACGNSVRNITACPYAGVAADEAFDVTPYAEAMTRFLLRHPLSSTLPRKFKIAFEGCPEDHIATAINDLGFRAILGPDGSRGFRVYAGGGTSIMPVDAATLHPFLAASEIFRVAEAILRVWAKYGDYQHKQRNRMKFMIKALGWARWREEYDRALAAIRLSGAVPTLEIEPPSSEPPATGPRPAAPDLGQVAARVGASKILGPGLTPIVVPLLDVTDAAFAAWHRTNVMRQKQSGYRMVIATIPLGDFTGQQMRVLGELATAFGDGMVRVTPDQDLVFRWVKESDVRDLYRQLAAAGLSQAEASTVADVLSCPGAESCRLAVTQSRGLGRLLEDHLRSRPELVEAADGARIKISGCPNGCGQHHIATFGFQGSVRRLDSQPVPQYFVMVGGGVTEENGASFARLAAKIPARRIPTVVDRLIALYQRERRDGESAPSYFARVDLETIKQTLADLEQLSSDSAEPSDFVDLGEVSAFNPLVMDGECAS